MLFAESLMGIYTKVKEKHLSTLALRWAVSILTVKQTNKENPPCNGMDDKAQHIFNKFSAILLSKPSTSKETGFNVRPHIGIVLQGYVIRLAG